MTDTTIPATQANASPATQANASSAAGVSQALSIIGLASQTIGSYYSAVSAREQYKQAALSYKFKADMTKINAELAEVQAQHIHRAGQYQAMAVGLKAGAMKSSAKVSLAQRGIQAGVGSASEVMTTTDLMKEIDLNTVNSNTVRAAEAQRMQAVGLQATATMQNLSASNMLSTASTINPAMQAGSTLLGGAGSVAKTFML